MGEGGCPLPPPLPPNSDCNRRLRGHVPKYLINKPGIRGKGLNEDTNTDFLHNLNLKVPNEGVEI